MSITDLDNEQYEILINCEKDSEDTSFNNIETYAKCVDVLDGDTCRIKFFYRDEISQISLRLYGINAPELRPKKGDRTVEDIENEKQLAILSKRKLTKMILNKIVYVKLKHYDKYGRTLANVYINKDDAKSINNIMVDKGYAIAYMI